MPDFTIYQQPGVYIEEQPAPLVNTIGVTPTVVAIVGPSIGYQLHTEAVTLSGTVASTLSQLGIDTDTVVVKAADGSLHASSTYALVAGAGADGNTGTEPDNTTTIARTTGSSIPDGSIVYVSYRYTNADYDEPLKLDDFEDVKDIYGDPFDLATGAIVSPLSMAAKFAFENGANQVVLVAAAGSPSATTRTGLSDAYPKLNALPEVNVVVALPVGIAGTTGVPGDVPQVGSDLKSYVEAATAEGMPRVGLIGYDRIVTLPLETAVASFRSQRIACLAPGRLHFFNGYANKTVEVDGYYLAAAAAGRMAGLPVQDSLTQQAIVGFSGLPVGVQAAMTKTYKNTLSDAGVMVAEIDQDNRLVIRHGTTTDRSNVNTRELSLVRSKDAMALSISATMRRAQLIGKPITPDMPVRIKGVVQGVLEALTNSGVILGYRDLAVRQQTLDPTVIEVNFAYRPAYPLNYIVVSFAIASTTGDVFTDLDLAA